MEWDAPSGFNLVSTIDTTVSMDTYTTPYKLSFTMPTAPLIFDRVLLDLNGSRLNPSCVDPNDNNFLYPLFSRIVIALDFNNDIFYDEIKGDVNFYTNNSELNIKIKKEFNNFIEIYIYKKQL